MYNIVSCNTWWILENTHIRLSTCPHEYLSYLALPTVPNIDYIFNLQPAKHSCRKPSRWGLVKGVLGRPKSHTLQLWRHKPWKGFFLFLNANRLKWVNFIEFVSYVGNFEVVFFLILLFVLFCLRMNTNSVKTEIDTNMV